jgi:tyrosyl-tRNA synthetase
MSWPDTMIATALEILTDMPLPEIKEIEKEMAQGKNPKIFKMLLAYKVVAVYCGTNQAIKAEEYFRQVFEERLNPDDLPEFKIKEKNIVEVLVATKLAASKSEARRLIKEGGIKVDQKTVKDEKFEIGQTDADGIVIQKGKRFFAKIIK